MMKKVRFRFVGALLVILVVFCSGVLAESFEGSTIRLLRYSGEIEILDTTGNPRFVMENTRFGSGETLITHADSGASVSLDSTKIVTLDADTRTVFAQEGSHLKLTLEAGSLFLDVQKKLDENETLDIETSTMTVGIRGTIVYVSERSGKSSGSSKKDETDHGETQLTVLEGTAEISYQDESGTRRVAEVPAGQTALIPHEMGENVVAKPVIVVTQPEHVEGFLVVNGEEDPGYIYQWIQDHPEIGGRIDNSGKTDPDNNGGIQQRPGINISELPANEDWQYTGLVTIAAQSASKLYDGSSLSRVNDALVTGLPAGFNISVSCSGSQTAAGSTKNRVASYSISNARNENVTSHFINIKTVDGTLTVSKAPLTIWTGSAEKVYDGEPLVCEEAGIRTVEGYVEEAPSWRNSATVTSSSTGGALMFGISGATWVHVTNPFTGKSRDLLLNAGERLNVNYTNADGEDPGIELNVDYVEDINDLPTEVLLLYADNRALMEQACEDAGWDAETLWELVRQAVKDQRSAADNGKTKTELMVESVDVRLTVDTAVTSGGVRTLGSNEAHFTAVSVPASVTVTATGSQTEVGESENTCEIDWGTEDKNNFIVSYELGTLTVTEAPVMDEVTLTAASAEKVYDGQTLSAAKVTVTGLPEGFTIETKVTGSQTNVGTSENEIESYTIYDPEKIDVTERFINVTLEKGVLTVTPASVKVTTGSAVKMYDGLPLTSAEIEITGLVEGETATVTATGSITHVGSTENTYTIDWGTTRSANYSVSAELGTLEVTSNSREITFTATIAEKDYDGTPLEASADSVTVTGLPAGFTYTVTVTGRQVGVGSSESEITDFRILNPNGETVEMGSAGDRAGTDVTLYFTGATTVKGTLTIDPAKVTVTTGSASKAYDGTALTNEEASITGLIAGETATVTATGSITEVGTAENSYTINWGETNQNNYTVTSEPGTLEVTANNTAITVIAPSMEKAYDGKALEAKAEDVTVTGLPSGLTYTATVSGSQTGAGSSNSEVTTFTVQDGTGTDVTAYFSGIEKVKGTLTVTTIPATITTGSASKAYDGTALTNTEGTITGLISGETATVTATGSITNVGMADNTYTIDWGENDKNNYTITENIGTLEVTANNTAITVTAPSAEKAYDGTALEAKKEDVTVTGLPSGLTYTATVSGSQTGAGSSNSEVTNFAVQDGTGTDVTAFFTGIEKVKGTLTVTAIPATITTGSASKAYDGTALTNEETSITGLIAGETATVTATGSITEVGTAENSYTINWGETDQNNYTVTAEPGTLEVTSNETAVTFTAPSAEKMYDGTALSATADQVSVTGLPTGFTYTATVSGSQTGAGSSDSEVTGYAILDGNGRDVNTYFTGIQTVKGTLTVTAIPATITTGSASKAYDGTALINAEGTITGLISGETATVTATGSITNVGTADNTYTIEWGETDKNNYTITENIGTLEVTANNTAITVTAPSAEKAYDGTALEAKKEDVTVTGLPSGLTYTTTVSGSQTGAGSSNSEITNFAVQDGTGTEVTAYFTGIEKVKGTLTVTAIPATISTGSASKAYDGTALINAEGTITGLISGETATVTATGSITNVGTADNTYTVDWGETDKNNYTITENIGTLEVTASNTAITVTAPSAEKAYDGTALEAKKEDVTVTGLPSGLTYTATVSGSQTGAGSNDSEITNFAVQDGIGTDVTANFTGIEKVKGTLIVTAIPATITTGSASKDYDGTALTNAEGTINGLISGETATVTATGSITNVGTTENSYTIDWGETDKNNYTVTESLGTLEVTQNTTSIVFTAGSDEKTYDGTPLTADVSVTGIPASLSYTAAASGSQKDVGSCSNDVSDYRILDSSSMDVTTYFTNISTISGTLKVNPTPLSITTASTSKAYDGTPLIGEDEAIVVGLAAGDSPVITLTGTQTEVGTSDNTYAIDWGTINPENYTLSENIGTLTVTTNDTPIVITSNSYEWEYRLYNFPDRKNYTIEGSIPGNVRIELTFGDYDNVPGEYDNSFEYAIYDQNNVDKKENFTNVTSVFGKLKINKAKVSAWTVEETITYDGKNHSARAQYTGVYGADGPSGSVIFTWTYVPTMRNVGEYVPTFEASLRSDLVDKYEMGNLTFNTITISPATLTVSTDSAEKTYDGTPLTAPGHLDGLASYDSGVTISTTVSVTDAAYGIPNDQYTIDWGSSNKDNYTIVEGDFGTLTVDKRNVTLTSETASKAYDGTPLQKPDVSGWEQSGDTGFVTGEMSGVEATGSVTEVNEGPVLNTITYYTTNAGFKADNYNITINEGELSIDPLILMINLGGGTYEYTGEEYYFDPSAVSVTYKNGLYEGYAAPLTPHDSTVGSCSYHVTLLSGEEFEFTVTGRGTEAGYHDITASIDCNESLLENLIFDTENEHIHITEAPPTGYPY